MIKPTIGRVVWYWPRGRLPAGGQPLAAQIAYVHDDRHINIGYLDQNGVAHSGVYVELLQAGDAEPVKGQFCEWMPYQVGQARAQEKAAA